MKKKFLLVLAAILLVQGLAFAQARTSLNIQCNQVGARVYINGNLAGYTSPNFSLLVTPGSYVISVVKDGYPEFKTTVVVGLAPITIQATLGSSPSGPSTPAVKMHQLTIDSNVRGAQVFLNGKFSGMTPFSTRLSAGSYYISLRMDGYEEYGNSVRLTETYHMFAALKPLPYPVYIDVPNAQGAAVYRDSVLMGTVPYRGQWMQGTYALRISAPGYGDYLDRITVVGPFTLKASLFPSIVQYEIRLPESLRYASGQMPGFGDILIIIDGQKLSGPYGTLNTGTHLMEVSLGQFRFTSTFELIQGGTAVIEPFMGVKVR